MICGKQHLHAREDQERAEEVEDPGEFGHQSSAKADHQPAQQDHADDAPEQHPVLIDTRHGKIGEDQGYDEDIVERQRLLDKEAGKEFKARGCPQVPPDPGTENHRDGDVSGRHHETLAHTDFMIGLVQDTKIEHQKGDDDAHKKQPQPDRLTQKIGCQAHHQPVHHALRNY